MMVAGLARQYQEQSVAMGLSLGGALYELFSSKNGETWTITKTEPGGLMCLMVGGRNWQNRQFQPREEGT